MASKNSELSERTVRFAIAAARLGRELGGNPESAVISLPLFASATGIAVSYRAAKQSHSRSEFIAGIRAALDRAEDSVFWLQYLLRAEVRKDDRVRALLEEAVALRAILTASLKTSKKHKPAAEQLASDTV